MNNRKIITIVSSILVLGILIWAPWITKGYAENVVYERFTDEWQGVLDGCGFNCEGCGVKESRRTLFGYSVQIEYACGMSPDSQEYHQTDKVYVSLFGTIHGLKKA